MKNMKKRKIYKNRQSIVTLIVLILLACFIPKEIEKNNDKVVKKVDKKIDTENGEISVPGYSGRLGFSHGLTDWNKYEVSGDTTVGFYSYIDFSQVTQFDGSDLVMRMVMSPAFDIVSSSATSGGTITTSGRTVVCKWPASTLSRKQFKLVVNTKFYASRISNSYLNKYTEMETIKIYTDSNSYDAGASGLSYIKYGSANHNIFDMFILLNRRNEVKLYPNGGTIASGSDVTYYLWGQTKKLPNASQMKREGYTFEGWYPNSDFSGGIKDSIGANDRGNKKFYAKWKASAKKVTLHPNGGTIASGHNVTSYVEGVGVKLPNSTTITKTGYVFKGWYDNSNLNGKSYSEIDKNAKGDKEFWAKWEPAVYKVTLVTKGGKISSGNVTKYTYGEGAKLPTATQISKRGNMFLGWYNNDACMGTAISSIGKNETGDKTFYAKWKAIEYDVKLHPEGGTISPGYNITKYTYGEGATLPTASRITKRGCTFAGWYDNSKYSGKAISNIGTDEIGNKEYWAKWTPNKYKVTFVTNGGKIESGNITSYTFGEGATLPEKVTKLGHEFKGWYDNSKFDGSPITRIGADEIGDKTFYAKWEPCVYNVKLHPNGGIIAEGVNVTEYTYGEGAKLPTGSQIRKEASEFVGWYDNSGLNGTPVTRITATDIGDKEYWAKWNTFDVSIAGGNSVNVYSLNDDEEVYKVDTFKYKVDTESNSPMEVYFTTTSLPTKGVLSKPVSIVKNKYQVLDIPDSVVKNIANYKQSKEIYLQVRVKATDADGIPYYIYITEEVKVSYCLAFRQY